MRRGYVEITQEQFRECLKDMIPNDALVYKVELEPKTASIQIFFYSEQAPDVPERVSAPFFYSGKIR
ncbi:MAG: hypothetical protein QXT73_00440 [Candidatus Methanomethylicaceae archaeon]